MIRQLSNINERKNSLYFSLYKEAVKVFGKKELEDLGIEDNIEKVQTRY